MLYISIDRVWLSLENLMRSGPEGLSALMHPRMGQSAPQQVLNQKIILNKIRFVREIKSGTGHKGLFL